MPTLITGAALCCAGLGVGSRRVATTRYRPDPWGPPEWIVAGSGMFAAVVLVVSASDGVAALTPSFSPLHWPSLPVLPTIAILVAAVAGIAAPPPPATEPATLPRRTPAMSAAA
jgi:energy-coupling factor transport system permease protein